MAQTTTSKNKKTNNSYLADKVALRLGHLPRKKEIYVLDCYAGKGLIWRAVQKLSGKDITTLPIDTSDDDTGFRLPGDNRGYLETLDLSQFDVIDLDAYRIPYDQMRIVFEREYHGFVFVTFIQSPFGRMPNRLLLDIGFSEEMITASPTLVGSMGWQYFKEWLRAMGVRKIWHRTHSRKHYLFFQI